MNNPVFSSADILLPKSDFETFAVIACDQYTSQPAYWQQVEGKVGNAPSALHITLPEIYLDQRQQRVEQINKTMETYIQSGVLREYKDAMILVHRKTESGVRKGIVGKIDLSAYDYHKGSRSFIRATEETVLERIPPRVEIRREAPLELPHVLLLMDDPDNTVMEKAEAALADAKKAYDFELMQQGGHLTGWFLPKQVQQQIQTALSQLATGEDPLLFVVGDGNHSLATAKECAGLSDSSKAGYALVEIVNVHDDAIAFEPIYRVLFGVQPEAVLKEMERDLGAGEEPTHTVCCVTAKGDRTLRLKATAKLPVGTLQPWLDQYLAAHPEVKIDYIHGEDAVRELCRQKGTLGFLFQGMEKNQLFDAVRQDGSLPRKTFSMGHANEKRYYVEGRKLR